MVTLPAVALVTATLRRITARVLLIGAGCLGPRRKLIYVPLPDPLAWLVDVVLPVFLILFCLGSPLGNYYLFKEGISNYPDTPPENLIKNGSFEDGLTNWKINFWDNPGGRAEIDSTERKEGNSSVKITVSEEVS